MFILFGLATFALAVLLHGLVMRLPMQMDSVKRFLMVGIPLGLALALFSLSRFGFTLDGFAAILLYALLSELYMFCFTLVISSVSVTMLIMLRQGSIEARDLVRNYEPEAMVQLRIERLVKVDLIQRIDNKLSVSAKGEKMNLIFSRLRRFFRHSS